MNSEQFQLLPKENILLISFEGIEGCGKSTQIGLVTEWLKSLNKYKVQSLREPGGTAFGEKLRDSMLNTQGSIHPLAEAHLFAASRTQLLHETITPLLQTKGNIIIFDRYIHSSIAYQGIAGNLGVKTILDIHSTPPLNYLPHITFYLKIDLETSLKRQEQRNAKKDYFESKDQNYYERLIEGFDTCEEKFKTVKPINGKSDQETIFQELKRIISEELP